MSATAPRVARPGDPPSGATRLTARGRAFAGGGLVLIAAGLLLGYPDLTRAGVLLLALVLLTRLFAARRPHGLVVAREVTPAVVAHGAPIAVRLRVGNTGGRRSRNLLAFERVDPALGDPPRFVLPGIEPQGERVVDYALESDRRGRHALGPLHLTWGDPFGLARRADLIEGDDHVVVLPRLVPLRRDAPAASGAGAHGHTPQFIALHGEQDVSIRAYRDGDDLRKVHWPATAHRGELMVRQEDRPARRACLLVLDPAMGHDADGRAYPGGAAAFEWAVSALASMAAELGRRGYAVRLVDAQTATDRGGPAGPAASSADAALIALAETAPDPGAAQRVMDAAQDALEPGAVVVAVVGDRAGGAADLARLRRPGTAGLAAIVDLAGPDGDAVPDPGRSAHPAEPQPGATAGTEAALAAHGWRTVRVGADTSVAQVWARLSARDRIGADS